MTNKRKMFEQRYYRMKNLKNTFSEGCHFCENASVMIIGVHQENLDL